MTADLETLRWVLVGTALPIKTTADDVSVLALIGAVPSRIEHTLYDAASATSTRCEEFAAFAAFVRHEQAIGSSRAAIARKAVAAGYSLVCQTSRSSNGDPRAAPALAVRGRGQYVCGPWISLIGFGAGRSGSPAPVRRIDRPDEALALLLACRFGLFGSPPASQTVCADLIVTLVYESETAIANARASLQNSIARVIDENARATAAITESFVTESTPDPNLAVSAAVLVLTAAFVMAVMLASRK